MNRLFGAVSGRGVIVDVLHRDRGDERKPKWASTTIAVGGTGEFDRRSQVGWGLRARRFLLRNAARYDAVHLQGLYLASQLASLGVRGRSLLLALPVLDGGDLGSPDDPGSNAKRAALKMAISRLDIAAALSTSISQDIQRLGLPAEKVFCLGNPADRSMFDVGIDRIQRRSEPVIGFVGKVGGFKNPHLLIDAARILASRHHPMRYLFAGPFESAELEQQLRERVAHSGLGDRVRFTGFVDDVAKQLREMDLFVLPSSREGLPGSLAEAMAAGLPSVVTDVGSMGLHVRRADAGLVVKPDAVAIADGIENALTDRWHRYSWNAKRYAGEHFSPESVATTYLRHVLPDLHQED